MKKKKKNWHDGEEQTLTDVKSVYVCVLCLCGSECEPPVNVSRPEPAGHLTKASGGNRLTESVAQNGLQCVQIHTGGESLPFTCQRHESLKTKKKKECGAGAEKMASGQILKATQEQGRVPAKIEEKKESQMLAHWLLKSNGCEMQHFIGIS